VSSALRHFILSDNQKVVIDVVKKYIAECVAV